MRKLQYKSYQIEVNTEPYYNPNSEDNLHYDKVFIVDNYDDRFSTCLSLSIDKDGEIIKVLFVAPYHTSIDACALPHEKGVFMWLDTVLLIFDVETLEIEKELSLDSVGTMITPYPYKEDYILHGELYICRVSPSLDIKWSFSAMDIWARYKGPEAALELKEDRICLYDFQDNYYEIDYDGNQLCERLKSSAKEGKSRSVLKFVSGLFKRRDSLNY